MKAHRNKKSRRVRPSRPVVESCEPRLLLATVTIGALDWIAQEGNTNDTAGFWVARTAAAQAPFWQGDLPVYYTVTGGTASSSDYQSLSGSVVIPDGENSAPVYVTATQDGNAEGYESLLVTLSANAAYTLGVSYQITAGIAIADDDVNALTVDTGKLTVLPAFDTIGVNIGYSGDNNQNSAMTVRYKPVGGSWVTGHDAFRVFPYYNQTQTTVLNSTNVLPNPEFATRLFNLTAGTTYDIELTFTDADGRNISTHSFQATTRSDPQMTASGSTYYVGYTNGNDTWNGLYSTYQGGSNGPFKTVSKGETVAVANTTICLMPGEHIVDSEVTFDQAGTATQPIVIKSYSSSNRAVVRSTKTGVDVPAGTNWQDDGATYQGVYSTPMTNKPAQVYYNNKYLGQSVTYLSDLVDGKCRRTADGVFYTMGTEGGWHWENGRLYVKIPAAYGDWAGTCVNPSAIGTEGAKGALFKPTGKYLVFKEIDFRLATGAFSMGITANDIGKNLTISDCTFEKIASSNAESAAIGFYQGSTAVITAALQEFLIQNCSFKVTDGYEYRDWGFGHDVGNVAAINIKQIQGADCGVIRNNTIDNIENCIFVGDGAPSIGRCEINQGWVIQNNTLAKFGDDGVELEGSSYNQAIIGNTLLQGHVAFAFAPAGMGPVWTIRNNICFRDWLDPNGQVRVGTGDVRTPYGIYKFNSDYNHPTRDVLNVAYHNSVIISTVQSDISAVTSKWQTREGVNFISRNNSFSIESGRSAGDNKVMRFYSLNPAAPDSLQTYNFDYDSFYVPDGNQYAAMWWQSTGVTEYYNSLAELQADGVNVHGKHWLPVYDDPDNGDFGVPANTVLHDSGVHIPGVNTGYNGAAPDIGSYEAAGTALPRYILTVANGKGDGEYIEDAVVPIEAVIPPGSMFDEWTGNVGYVTDVNDPTTTVTMPAAAVTVTATFQAAIYAVGSGQTYSTVQAAVTAACLYDSSSGIVRIMDSGTYNEKVSVGIGEGDVGQTLIIEAAEGQTPSIASIYFYGDYDCVVRGVTIDGNLTPAGGKQGDLFYLRGLGNHRVEDCTIKATGATTTLTMRVYGAENKTIYILNNVWDSATKGIFSSDDKGSCIIEGNVFNGSQGIDWSRATVNYGTILVQNNVFNQCSSYGFYRRSGNAGTNIHLENNTFYRCGGGTYTGAIVIRDSANLGVVMKDNLIAGKGSSSTDLVSLSSHSTAVNQLDLEYNGFWNMRQESSIPQVAYLGSDWKSKDEVEAISGGSANNVVSTSANSPFVDAANGDFHLKSNGDADWALDAASDGQYIGALPASIPTITLSATDNAAAETAGNNGTFTVTRSGSTSGALVVHYAVSGTADNTSSDLDAVLTGSVTIQSGNATAPITVDPKDDTAIEGDETITLTLSTNVNYTVGSPSTGTVTITDSDATMYTVGSGKTYSTIQAAVNAVSTAAAGNYVLRIFSGTYNECVGFPISGSPTFTNKTVAFQANRNDARVPETVTLHSINAYLSSKAPSALAVDALIFDSALKSSTPTGLIGAIQLRCDASLTVLGSTFNYQTYASWGGPYAAIYIRNDGASGQNAAVLIDGNTFNMNDLSVDLAGVYAYNTNKSDVEIRNNRFNGMAGIIDYTSELTYNTLNIHNNVFWKNVNSGYSRRVDSASVVPTWVTIENNTFYQCGSTASSTGALFIRNDGSSDVGAVIKDNLFVGDGSSSKYQGINTYGAKTAINADYNAFVNMYNGRVAYMGAWKTDSDLNGYTGASENDTNDSLTLDELFVDPTNGDLHLESGVWALTFASDDSFVGALGTA